MAEITIPGPAKDKATAIGKRVKRLDGLAKSTGTAKYTYDINLKNQLIAKGLGCPHAHCKIKSIDVAPALKVPGVVHAEAAPAKRQRDRVAGRTARRRRCRDRRRRPRRGRRDQGRIRNARRLRRATTTSQRPKPPAAPAKAAARRRPIKEPGDDDDEDDFVAKEIDRLLQGVGPRRRRLLRHRRHHALLPGAARLDGRVGRQQADRVPLDAERLAAPTKALPTT